MTLINGAEIRTIATSEGNAGNIDIVATGDISVDGESLGVALNQNSEISSQVRSEDEDVDAGKLNISTTNLVLTNGGQINANTNTVGVAGDITINATESIVIDGISRPKEFFDEGAIVRSGISSSAFRRVGEGGDISVSTDRLTIRNSGLIEAGNFDSSSEFDPGTGQPGNINIEANSIDLTTEGGIETRTQSETGVSGIINLKVADNITLRDNSFISAEATGDANGGNLNIDTNFIIAFPDGDNDITASAEQGNGGNININAESLFGIKERPLNDATNDINTSSDFSLDGNISVSTLDVDPVQGSAELPTNIVVPEETTQQACTSNRESAARNGLNITGKGGVVPDPALPLSSLNVTGNKKANSASAIPQSIATSQGKIQPARGIKIAKSGKIILTAYQTSNAGERLPEIKRNCDRI